MADLTPKALAKLRRLAAEASPGPWTHDDGNVFSVPLGKPRRDALTLRWSTSPPTNVGPIPEENGFLMGGQENDNYDANASYVAAANPDTVLALLDRIAKLEAEQAHLERGAELLRESAADAPENAREWPRLAAWLDADAALRAVPPVGRGR
jgi:hypothetical protein